MNGIYNIHVITRSKTCNDKRSRRVKIYVNPFATVKVEHSSYQKNSKVHCYILVPIRNVTETNRTISFPRTLEPL